MWVMFFSIWFISLSIIPSRSIHVIGNDKISFHILWLSSTTHTHRLSKWLNDKESTCQCRRCRRCGFDPWVGKLLEGNMATHSSTLAWKIPQTEEPDMLQSTGSERVGHDWVSTRSMHTYICHIFISSSIDEYLRCFHVSISWQL